MKTKWSALFSLTLLFTLASCGAEQFGTVPRSETNAVAPPIGFSHSSCTQSTLIKPKVDVLYVVDNSASNIEIPLSVQNGIKNTANSLSSDFDYRVIGTPLLETNSGNQDYQVMTNSTDLQGIVNTKRVYTPSAFNFFTKDPKYQEREKGLQRTLSFLEYHKTTHLLRSGAHLVIILVSNGRDREVEYVPNSGAPTTIEAEYENRRDRLISIKNTLGLQQLRFFSVSAKSQKCTPQLPEKEGWLSSNASYVKLAEELYSLSGSGDNNFYKDAYDLCKESEYQNLFTGINNSIKQVVLKHSYRFWPITFAEDNDTVDVNQLKVFNVKPNGQRTELTKGTIWEYVSYNPKKIVNTRELPTVGEPVEGKHFIQFKNGHLVTFPDCVLITSTSKTEYFGWIVLPAKPDPTVEMSIRINGNVLPRSAWGTYPVTATTRNIKVDNLGANPPGSKDPPIIKTGFMIELNSNYYYRSGDTVDVSYKASGI